MQEDKSKQRTSNDQRSDVHNPTSVEYRATMNDHANQSNLGSAANTAAANNRANQMNPNNPSYHSSRSGGKGKK